LSYLIVGIGNIGAEYLGTRHNIGFDVLDYHANEHGASFELGRHAFYSSYRSKGQQIHLIKPTTYVNLSGKAVRYWMQETKTGIDNILVVVDDIHLDFGSIRIKRRGSHGGHNGLKDIEAALGSSSYPRLRFGVGKDFPPGQQVRYVLGKWHKSQEKDLPNLIDDASKAIDTFIHQGLDKAMNQFNR
jgi:PTH1 family peptidyl-tRNA hydrolase